MPTKQQPGVHWLEPHTPKNQIKAGKQAEVRGEQGTPLAPQVQLKITQASEQNKCLNYLFAASFSRGSGGEKENLLSKAGRAALLF